MAKTRVMAHNAPRTATRDFLVNVPDSKVLISHDGQSFKNLNELAQGLLRMKDETYRFHVKIRKNDFAKWVREVIGDQELANDLKQSMTRLDASRKVRDRVYYLSSIK